MVKMEGPGSKQPRPHLLLSHKLRASSCRSGVNRCQLKVISNSRVHRGKTPIMADWGQKVKSAHWAKGGGAFIILQVYNLFCLWHTQVVDSVIRRGGNHMLHDCYKSIRTVAVTLKTWYFVICLLLHRRSTTNKKNPHVLVLVLVRHAKHIFVQQIIRCMTLSSVSLRASASAGWPARKSKSCERMWMGAKEGQKASFLGKLAASDTHVRKAEEGVVGVAGSIELRTQCSEWNTSWRKLTCKHFKNNHPLPVYSNCYLQIFFSFYCNGSNKSNECNPL